MADPLQRLDPFTLAFGPFIPDRLAEMHRALAEADVDRYSRDAWALSRSGAALLHDLRPDRGLGEAVAELVALAHAGFLYWQHGERVEALSREALDALPAAPAAPAALGTSVDAPAAYYLQLPPRRVWGTPVEEAPPEPLDGCFVVAGGGQLQVVAIFGLLPGRPGFTVAHVGGPPPGPLLRNDGSPAFAPTLEGGAAAGLWSIVGQEEMLEFAWRAHQRTLARSGPAQAEAAAR